MPDRLNAALPCPAAVLSRPVCELLGCTYPIVLAGMGGVARAELVGAVTEAGGFGFLGMVREPIELIRQEVQRVRAHTGRKFGVNLIPAATESVLLDAQIGACIELGVTVVGLFWDVVPAVVRRLRDAGIMVVYQVGSVQDARAAQDAGAQILIAQGCEAGGHVRGEQPLCRLMPDVIAGTSIPVLAAGGIVDGADVATALSMGAQGVVVGTAFIATHESFAHAYHMQRIVESTEGDTVLTTAFHINWPRDAKVRVLSNSVIRGEHGDPDQPEKRAIGEEQGRPIYLFSTDSPLRSMTGDFEAMALYAGKGVSRVHAITSAAERLNYMVSEAASRLQTQVAPLPPRVEVSSPPCFASDMDDAYMGYAAKDELCVSLNELLEAERAVARVTLHTATQAIAPDLRQQVIRTHHDAVRGCGVLIQAIQSMNGTPSRKTGELYEQALATPDLSQRMLVLKQGRGRMLAELQSLVPRVRDEHLQAELAAMLASHKENIERLGSHFVTAAGAPDGRGARS